MTTDNDVCNQALDLLREAPLTDYLTDDTPESRWFIRNYATARDAELEEHPWKFALKRASIPADATAPTFDWAYRYAVPGDFKALARFTYDGTFEGTPVPHEIEGAWILTNLSSTIKIVYVYAITDPTLFSALFVEALAAKLATKMAHWMTGKASMVQVAGAAYQTAIARAKRANALLSTPERAYDTDVISARYE